MGNLNMSHDKVAVVTGAAKRIGAAIARLLHADGYKVAIHCHKSTDAAQQLAADFNALRASSAMVVQAKLGQKASAEHIVNETLTKWGQIDALVNNASSFYPTPIGDIDDEQVEDLIASNLSAPLFLSQAAAIALKTSQGCIVNMVDIHGIKPLAAHSVYSAAKSGLIMLTQSMALELAPDVRVNGVAPGVILWPQGNSAPTETEIKQKIKQVPLQKQGTAEDIAQTILFLISPQANYITGQIINVDGGKSLC